MDFAVVFDENAALGRPSKALGPLAGAPAKLGGAEPARRALGDISNKGDAAGGKAAALAPRRALGDITNATSSSSAAQAQPAKPPSKLVLPAELAALPISERTASFVTEEVLALARVYAAEGTEQLAGMSGSEQLASAQQEEEARAQATLARLLAPPVWTCEQQVRPDDGARAPVKQLIPVQLSELDVSLENETEYESREPALDEGAHMGAMHSPLRRVGSAHGSGTQAH